VVGAGAAGTAAAWHAARAGAQVVLVHDRAGATELFSGALDGCLLEGEAESSACSLQRFSTEFQIWSLGRAGCRVATGLGVVRRAAGLQAPLLDLAAVAGGQVGVVQMERFGWDGHQLARTLAESAWARQTATSFSAISVDLLEEPYEPRLSDYDFALLQDSRKRRERWAAKLRQASTQVDAWLLGPWLGVDGETGPALSATVGRAVGETTSLPGGPAGARFVQARQQLLERAGVLVQPGRVVTVRPEQPGWSVQFETLDDRGAESHTEALAADAVVLAAGGLVSGAVKLVGWQPDGQPRAGFALAFDVPASLKLDAIWVDQVSSLRGLDLQDWGSDALERVGVAVQGARVQAAHTGLFAAGSLMAGRPRTMLEAVRSGIAAAQAALA
jgi:anaerobic glycerol-3-phosphate dehydrogenase